jgi:hypothetical protein
MRFNTTNGDFEAKFIYDSSVILPTVVYCSEQYWYSDGFELSLSDSDGNSLSKSDYTVEWNDENYTSVNLINKALNGKVITLNIKPKIASIIA